LKRQPNRAERGKTIYLVVWKKGIRRKKGKRRYTVRTNLTTILCGEKGKRKDMVDKRENWKRNSWDRGKRGADNGEKVGWLGTRSERENNIPLLE